MKKTLIILAHPNIEQSVANKNGYLNATELPIHSVHGIMGEAINEEKVLKSAKNMENI